MIAASLSYELCVSRAFDIDQCSVYSLTLSIEANTNTMRVPSDYSLNGWTSFTCHSDTVRHLGVLSSYSSLFFYSNPLLGECWPLVARLNRFNLV